MMSMTLQQIADIVGGTLHDVSDPSATVTGAVEFDSRKVGAGDLFLALPGARVDGHDHAEAATLLASSDRSPVHTWRAGRLLAFQHHPESDPARVAYWRTRDALNDLAGTMDAASLQAARNARRRALRRGINERIAVVADLRP